MRPCGLCGHALQNHQEKCDICHAEQSLALGAKQPPSDRPAPAPSLGNRLGQLLWFLAELLLRTVLVGVPLSLGLSLIALVVVWDSVALLIGTVAGTILAACYALTEMYFEHQVFRGPLR